MKDLCASLRALVGLLYQVPLVYWYPAIHSICCPGLPLALIMAFAVNMVRRKRQVQTRKQKRRRKMRWKQLLPLALVRSPKVNASPASEIIMGSYTWNKVQNILDVQSYITTSSAHLCSIPVMWKESWVVKCWESKLGSLGIILVRIFTEC